MASGHSSWRAEDLLDVELASTTLYSGEGGSGNGWGQGTLNSEVDFTYDMSELGNLLLDQLCPTPNSALTTPPHSILATPPHPAHQHPQADGGQFEVVLKAPTAYGIKTDRDKVTYLNKGYSYDIQLKHFGSSPLLFNSTLSLGFCRRNSERQHFEEWSKDHPCDRLLEIDSLGSVGLSRACNDESALNVIQFTWGESSQAVLAVKINCLSTEFAAKKHGGEKGIPLKLYLEMSLADKEGLSGCVQVLYRRGCVIKVFKDKGGDRKQRQDQTKIEKLPLDEQAKFHPSDSTTVFLPCDLDSSGISNNSSLSTSLSFTPKSESAAQTPGASPLLASPSLSSSATKKPCSLGPAHPGMIGPAHPGGVAACCTVEETREWLLVNRFGQYCSLFANFNGTDLLQLSRQDLLDLCGHADGIRLHNSLHSRTLKTLYLKFPQDKVYQAICLEELTVRELLARIQEKLVGLDVQRVSSFVRVTGGGVCVRVDDTVVLTMHNEASFLLQMIKEENGSCQLVLQDHTPSELDLPLSLTGGTSRH